MAIKYSVLKYEKVWQIVDKHGNVQVFNEDFDDTKPLNLTHFTRNEAEEALNDMWLKSCKQGEDVEFYRKGLHVVKDKTMIKTKVY